MPAWGHINTTGNIKNTNLNRAATRHGNKGELATMELLDTHFASNPNLHIFHDLNIPQTPGSHQQANVDHLILTRDTAILVDTKTWKPGIYKTTKRGTKRNGEPFPYADSRTLDLAADRYTRHLTQTPQPPNLNWIAIYAIWPTKNTRTSLWRIHPQHTIPTLYTKATHLPLLIPALLPNPTPPDTTTTNLFLQHLRKPTKT